MITGWVVNGWWDFELVGTLLTTCNFNVHEVFKAAIPGAVRGDYNKVIDWAHKQPDPVRIL